MIHYQLQYIPLVPSDPDIPFLFEVHSLPEISEYIHIDRSNYFHYVTNTAGVYYYKVMYENKIVAAIHIERADRTLYLSILTLPNYQNQGFGSQILKDTKETRLLHGFSEIIAYVDRENMPSIRLFEKAGFTFVSAENELLEYHLDV